MGMQSVAVACGALTLCLALTTATNPGFVVRITQTGLDYAQQQGIAILEKELAQLKLPDFSGKSGKVRYSFSRLRIPTFRLPHSRITPIPNVGLQVSISNAFAELDGDWRVKFLFMLPVLVYVPVCDNVAKSVQNELQKQVRTLPVTARIDNKIGIDYSLVAPPRATTKSLDVDLKGEFYSLAHRSPVPFSPLPLAFPSDHERMVYFGASSYFFNTAGIAYHEAGALVFEITEAMIPKEARFSLDTSLFSAFIPQLEEMYPNMPMKFRVSTPTAPFLTIGEGGISFQPIVDVQAYAIFPNSSLAPLFLLSLTGNVSAVINVRSGRIVGSLDVGRIRLSLKDSAVGTFQVTRLSEGFRLPLPDRIQLSNILVRFHQNFLLLGADVRFQPRR
ncbi:bactericidal permeability-increasing protein-like [Zonotrichia albicollis]|uniref:bactericidal permeability-increasing protein-like n=1 Tax=Zonotrichia albicollis TaxID=44394 RepID=UPI003D80E6C4